MKVYFITRFSIYDPHFKGFRLSSDHDPEEYERQLFSAPRMSHKFETFQRNTLPSVVKQSSGNWKWLIYTSDKLPGEYLQRLRNLVADHQNIEIIQVKGFQEFFEHDRSYAYESPFATVRLDDDDGLSPSFVETVQQYASRQGSIISFTEGRKVKCIDGQLIIGAKVSEKNNAQGMVGIGVRIYNCGSHTSMSTRYNVIYDTTPEMFLVDCSPFTDTKRAFTRFGRIMVKLKRLFFLALHRPKELPRECAAPLLKLFGR
jgi:hypothetical protein